MKLAGGGKYASLKGMVTLDEACARLAGLSEERAKRVLLLIEDLAELEALENAEDLTAARQVLAHSDSVPLPWPNLKSELDMFHRLIE